MSRISLTLTSGPGLEHSKPPQALLTNTGQILALTPGIWKASVMSWEEGKNTRYSAINSWNVPNKWTCQFYYGVFSAKHPLALKGVGNAEPKLSAKDAFDGFQQGTKFEIDAGSRGPKYPVQVILMLPTDFYHEDGEMRIDLEWVGFT